MPLELTEKEWKEPSLTDIDDEDAETLIVKDKKLVRKIDFRLLPWICLLYSLSLVDRYVNCIP